MKRRSVFVLLTAMSALVPELTAQTNPFIGIC
jgi:hypothetical protein